MTLELTDDVLLRLSFYPFGFDSKTWSFVDWFILVSRNILSPLFKHTSIGLCPHASSIWGDAASFSNSSAVSFFWTHSPYTALYALFYPSVSKLHEVFLNFAVTVIGLVAALSVCRKSIRSIKCHISSYRSSTAPWSASSELAGSNYEVWCTGFCESLDIRKTFTISF